MRFKFVFSAEWPSLPQCLALCLNIIIHSLLAQPGYLNCVMTHTLYARNVAVRYVVMIRFAMNAVHGLRIFAECI